MRVQLHLPPLRSLDLLISPGARGRLYIDTLLSLALQHLLWRGDCIALQHLSWRGDYINCPTPVMEREETVLLLKHLSWRGRGLYYTLTPIIEKEGTVLLSNACHGEGTVLPCKQLAGPWDVVCITSFLFVFASVSQSLNVCAKIDFYCTPQHTRTYPHYTTSQTYSRA